MQTRLRFAAAAAALLAIATPVATGTGSGPVVGTAALADLNASKWIVDRSDNICGLDDPRMLSRPAKVDYEALLGATPEMKKLRDDKVDPNSSEGIQLRQKAVDRLRNAADKVRLSEGYCSVWKQIRHQDGRVIPDVTDLVRAQI